MSIFLLIERFKLNVNYKLCFDQPVYFNQVKYDKYDLIISTHTKYNADKIKEIPKHNIENHN